MSDHFISESLQSAQKVLSDFLSNSSQLEMVDKAVDLLATSLERDHHLYSCGNGGSSCDAAHFAEELTGRYKKDRKPFAATTINDAGHISCVANDFGYEYVFSRYLEAWGKSGDVLLAISTSGNSANVIQAAKMAHIKKMKVIGLLGKDGVELKELVDIPIIVPSQDTERIQEMHIKLIHIFIEGIERQLTPNLW